MRGDGVTVQAEPQPALTRGGHGHQHRGGGEVGDLERTWAEEVTRRGAEGVAIARSVGLPDRVSGATVRSEALTRAWAASVVGGAATGSITHTFSQAQVDVGTYTNTGTARGTGTNGTPVSDTDPETVTLARNPVVTIIKQVSVDGGRRWREARLEGPVLAKCLTRFNLDWSWDGQPALVQSRATDETGHIQPDSAQLRAVRGTRSIYHNNAIQTWLVQASGEVGNVQLS